MTPALTPRTYAELRRAVEVTMIRGQREADLARVRSYHETGRLILAHVLLFKDRAAHGAGTIQRLSDDLEVDRSVLQRCVKFARAFPNWAGRPNLTWAHYRVLLPVSEAARRSALATEADKNGWTADRLEQRIRALAQSADTAKPVIESGVPPKPLTPKRGTVGVWRVVASDDGPAVDLGFTAYVDLPAATKLEEGAFVRAAGDSGWEPAPEATTADLYTYPAEVLRVVDGDTLWVKIYLRPGLWVKEKLRLRGLDCPEMETSEGRAAKRFVEVLVARAEAVTIATFKPDKYDRYLADVFLHPATGDRAEAMGETVFLNNELLANGHAARKDEYSLTDWDPPASK